MSVMVPGTGHVIPKLMKRSCPPPPPPLGDSGEMETRALHRQGRCSTTEPHAQSLFCFEMGSLYEAQAGVEPKIILLPPLNSGTTAPTSQKHPQKRIFQKAKQTHRGGQTQREPRCHRCRHGQRYLYVPSPGKVESEGTLSHHTVGRRGVGQPRWQTLFRHRATQRPHSSEHTHRSVVKTQL